jgi:hypothetical protein
MVVHYGVDYIFTEIMIEFINTPFKLINIFFSALLSTLSITLPHIVKNFIGYCHFYYQLGYGLVFYIYLFRRYRAKKNKNWKTFYGNSFTNWVIFVFSIFNKFFTDRKLFIYIKDQITTTLNIIYFLVISAPLKNNTFLKIKKLYKYLTKNSNSYTWTPLIKKSSYINFFTFLNRFTKRK